MTKIIFILLFLIGCGAKAPYMPEHSDNHTGPLMGWSSSTTIFYTQAISDKGLVQSLLNAVDTWNEAAGQTILTVSDEPVENLLTTSLYQSLSDNQNVVMLVDNWNEATRQGSSQEGKKTSVLGTTIWDKDDSGYMTQADILLNSSNYVFTDVTTHTFDPNDLTEYVDAESVLLHELGHFLGLDHSDSYQSIMFPTLPIGSSQTHRIVSDLDRESIKKLYP